LLVVEDHSLHHEWEDLDEFKPQEVAAMRWQAIEAFNRIPGLSPAARRVGIELICTMDAKTRACFPGELRLAGMLNMWPSAIKKGKAELRDAGLLTWTNPGGPRHQSHYRFSWDALTRLSQEAKSRGEIATETRKFEPVDASLQQPHQRTLDSVSKQPQARTLENAKSVSKDLRTEIQRPQTELQQPHQRTSNNLTRGPELSHLTTHLDTAQHITPSQADGGLGSAKNLDRPFVSHSAPQQMEPKGALEEKDPIYPRPPPPRPAKVETGPHCFYPKLLEEFGSDLQLSVKIQRLGFDQQTEASKLLNMKGKGREVALAFILEQSKQGAAA
jgi:hypothetical protein